MPNYETMDIFAKNLTRLLEEKDITQLALAQIMSVSPSTVSFWCNGEKMPRMNRIEKMAAYFGVPKSALLESVPQGGDLLDAVDVAFYGKYRTLSEDDRQTIRDMVDLMRKRRKAKEERQA